MTAPRTRGPAGLLLVGLLVLLAFVYAPVLEGNLFAGRDLFRMFFPDSAFLLESLHAGEVPLWNPYLRLGQPFAATLYSQVYYPPRWAAVLLTGPIVSMTVMQVGHVVLAAAGVFRLCRRLRASWAAAAVAGVTFGLSVLMTRLGTQQNVVDAAAWSGFLVGAALDVHHRPGRGALGPMARLAVYGALSLFAGSPETTLWQGMVAVLVAGGAPRCASVARVRSVARVTGGFALAAMLAAVALLPAAEFARNSLRMQGSWRWPLVWSMSWPQVLSALWPLADWPRDRYWGEDQWFILSVFLGTLPCALALLGALRGPRRVRPFAVGALVLVALSLGRHFAPASWVLLHVPPFSLFRYPVKYFVGAAFCVSVLSAFGVDALGRLARRLRPSRLRAAVALVGMVGAMAALGPVARALSMRASAEAGAPWVPLWLGLATLVVLWPRGGFARARQVRQGVAVLAVLEVAASHALLGRPGYAPLESLLRPFSLRVFLPQPYPGRISVDIQAPEDPSREGAGNTIERSLEQLIPNRFVEARLPALEGSGAPEPVYSEVFHDAGRRTVFDLAGVTHYLRNGPPPYDDLELLHTADDGTTLSRSRTAMPRAFLVQRARVVTDAQALAAVEDDSQPFRHTAFLASGAPLERPACTGSVEWVRQGAQHLELKVEACDESYLVVSDSHYPGWTATVDGQDAPIHRADLALRAVRVPRGLHMVRFDYRPLSFRVGLALSVLSALGLAAVVLRRPRAP
ncbi:YfhO family protein [Corallococcus macrosporus]|uniref:YfhO family protein n=1 Tax=Corallococcus macrosporus TaxID=35 RepID=A0ABS3DD69_9BACT|nr:YfhO family protein [Corallococcus macrosporus]MBN8228791.1 YfhO family protein [Corallococcus macrosporus]